MVKTCFLSGSKHLVGKMSAVNVMVAPCSTLLQAFVVVSWVPVHLNAKKDWLGSWYTLIGIVGRRNFYLLEIVTMTSSGTLSTFTLIVEVISP